ncbi:MAG: pyridoxal phosphate-dependent aminotransferase [Chthonomonas sp.]|nr:pyridoxal phosphate-dependent aminotransferase [Chthonomonas sp.]
MIKPSPTLAITAKARRLKQEGKDVISFGAGEPDFDTPSVICDRAIQAIRNGETRYTPSAGTVLMREAVSKKFERENGLSYTADQIVVSCGAKHSIYNALQVTINPGDEVILIAPYWMTYADQIRLAGGEPRVIHTSQESGFKPTFDQLRGAITPKTRAIIVNSPSNPTGAVQSRETLKEIASLAIKHDFWIITDEIYERLIYGSVHESIAALGSDVYDRTITVAGCSKTYAMTGWRIGYAAAPLEVARAMSMLQDQVTSNPTAFAQAGAIAALEMPNDAIEAMRSEFEARRDLIIGMLNAIPGISCAVPGGAFYAFADFSETLREGETDIELASELLDNAYLAVVPGTVFEGPGCLRFSYATSREEISRGVNRLGDYLASRSA